jgi:hypothetical protein
VWLAEDDGGVGVGEGKKAGTELWATDEVEKNGEYRNETALQRCLQVEFCDSKSASFEVSE